MSLSMAVVSMAAPPMAALSMAAVKDLSISCFNHHLPSTACPYLDESDRDLENLNKCPKPSWQAKRPPPQKKN